MKWGRELGQSETQNPPAMKVLILHRSLTWCQHPCPPTPTHGEADPSPTQALFCFVWVEKVVCLSANQLLPC